MQHNLDNVSNTVSIQLDKRGKWKQQYKPVMESVRT